MATIETRLAKSIKDLMGEDHTINSLHEQTGIPYNTLKRRITDGRGLEVYELAAIARALDVEPYDLIKLAQAYETHLAEAG